MALEKEFQYYIQHQEELVTKHQGKYLVIKEDVVIGVYDDNMTAYSETIKTHKLGTFLIQHCLPGKDSYTQTFHSRVYNHPVNA